MASVCPYCGMSTWLEPHDRGPMAGCALPGCEGYPVTQREWMAERMTALGDLSFEYAWQELGSALALVGVKGDVLRLRSEWTQRERDL